MISHVSTEYGYVFSGDPVCNGWRREFTMVDKVETIESNKEDSADATVALLKEANAGKPELVEKDKERAQEVKSGKTTGVTGEFGSLELITPKGGVRPQVIYDNERGMCIEPRADVPSRKDDARDAKNEEVGTFDKYDELDAERARLYETSRTRITDKAELKKFDEDVDKLEHREDELTETYRKQYEVKGYSPDEAEDMGRKRAVGEITDTMTQTRRILDAEGEKPMNSDARKMVAMDVMHHAGDPNTVDQGRYGTCQAAAQESRMYAQDPSTAAKLCADVATTGEYKAGDGTHVKLHPDNLTYQGGGRDFGSQIFQSTAVQLRYQDKYPNVDYVCTPGANGDPDHFFDRSTGKEALEDDGTPWVFRGYPTEDIARVNNKITGRREYDTALTTPPCDIEPKYATKIESENQLDDKLTQLKNEGKLPVVVWVHTGNEPFLTDSGHGKEGGSGSGHYVTITDFDKGPPAQIAVDNQWGEGNDHNWKQPEDKKKSLSLHEMYRAMHAPGTVA
jgi:hypothetical protein